MYDLALSKDQNNPKVYYHLAKFYQTKNKPFKALKNFNKAIDKLNGVGQYKIYNKKGLEVYEYEIHLSLYNIYKNDFEDLEEACDELQKAKSSLNNDIDALIYHPNALSEIEALIIANCN
jgi:tetratricopeptide (TPR) repeat protein